MEHTQYRLLKQAEDEKMFEHGFGRIVIGWQHYVTLSLSDYHRMVYSLICTFGNSVTVV